MEDLILKAIQQFSLISSGDNVIVAVSGGADSIALLHSLNIIKDKLNFTLKAAHFNHLIRGEEAKRDQEFVADFCKKIGVDLIVGESNVPQYAEENHMSIETAARELRYNFFESISNGKIATAHTASDNLETMLFNLSRGTLIKGLCGIPEKRGIYIRPLIFCTRKDVEDYCKDNNLEFVTDSTNLSDCYSRNNIRHNVVPVLKAINPNIEISATRTAFSLKEDANFLDNTAEAKLFRLVQDDFLEISDFEALHPSIAKRILLKFFNIQFPNINLENKHIIDIYDIVLNKKGKINLPYNLYAEIIGSYLHFFNNAESSFPEFEVTIKKAENVNSLFSNQYIDYDKIKGELVVRTRNEGDSIRLYKRGCTKTLKKLFTEFKIPTSIRNQIPVISDDKGVVWVYNIGVCDRCAVTDKTKNIFKIEVLEKKCGE